MKFDSTNTFLTVVSLAMFSITSVLVALLTCEPARPEQQCDPENLVDPQCEEGQTCSEEGACIDDLVGELEPTRECRPGERVTACTCPPRLEVRGELCEVPSGATVCEHAEVAALLARLDQACSGERNTAPGRLGNCPPADLRDVVIGSHRDTLKIAEAFQAQSFTLHFKVGTPHKSGARTWPGAATRTDLRDIVKAHLEHIEPRGYLLMIALASATGSQKLNFDLATRRSDTAVALVGDARDSFPRFGEHLTDVKTLVGLIGHEERATLDIATFDRIWGATDRFHAWDDASTRRLRADLAAWRDGKLHGKQLQWLTQVINQSVLVIPLPCDLPTARRHG